MTEVHSCSYYCDRPQCIKAQRDELRERLARPEQGPVALESFFKRYCPWLAQPEQEPVACVQDLDEVKRKHLVYEKGMDWKDPLYTAPPQRKPPTA